jgi:aminoglycoside phosphotransferase family enzyme
MSTITDTGVVAGLVAALTPPGGAEPELRQTRLSWVFLTAGRAYKLKKPVRFDFLDLDTTRPAEAVRDLVAAWLDAAP